MKASKILPLALLLVLVFGVLAFPLASEKAGERGVSGSRETVSNGTSEIAAVTTARTGAEKTAALQTDARATRGSNSAQKTVKAHTVAARKGTSTRQTTAHQALVDENGQYYDLEHVVLYLEIYGRLPRNYLTKSRARALGWSSGAVDVYQKGAAIGGDRFGNFEKRLPAGGVYTECDIDTAGKERGAKRLVFSDDRRYYYTDDHYATFTEVVVRGGSVEKK